MSRIRSKHTAPELRVRQALHSKGFRYRLHGNRIIGSPDLVFKSKMAVIFIHGCFWHQHPGCTNAATVKDDADSKWASKLRSNVERDEQNKARALEGGYTVAVVWECSLEPRKKKSAVRQYTIEQLVDWLNDGSRQKTIEF